MKKIAILLAVFAMAIFFASQDAMAQHRHGGNGYRHGGHGYRHGGHGYRHGGHYGSRSSFAVSVGGPYSNFSYGSGYYGRPYGWGVPVAPVVPIYGPGYGYGGGCGGGGGGVFIGW